MNWRKTNMIIIILKLPHNFQTCILCILMTDNNQYFHFLLIILCLVFWKQLSFYCFDCLFGCHKSPDISMVEAKYFMLEFFFLFQLLHFTIDLREWYVTGSVGLNQQTEYFLRTEVCLASPFQALPLSLSNQKPPSITMGLHAKIAVLGGEEKYS